MSQLTFKSATKRYWRVLTPFVVIYFIIIVGGSIYLAMQEVEPVWLQATIAVACAIPATICIFAFIRYIFETDEYHQMIYLKSVAIGSGVTVSVIILVGLLQVFHVLDRVEAFWFSSTFFVAVVSAIPLFAQRSPNE